MLLEHIVQIAQVVGIFVTGLFILSVVIKRNDIADIAWGVGIFLVALLSYGAVDQQTLLHTVLLVLAALWGGRLSLRIFLRNIKKSVDYRYKKWRDEWGKWFYPRSYAQVYLLQGALMLVVGYPFVHASVYASDVTLGIIQLVGLLVWGVGYVFEAVGDWQLDRFLARPENRGQVMQTGLWKYSRHPNYFGEVTMWWGIWLLVAPLPLSYIALLSPITITFLILKVSGIPLLEQKFAGNPAFEAYKKRTSVFLPLPPKNI